jgi:colanic acid/amylovoran biosynthesis glycosyltransferase
MRVAFLANRFPALSETFVLDQATGILERGCELDVYCETEPSAPRHPEAGRLDGRVHEYRAPRRYVRRLVTGARLLANGGARLRRALNPFKYGMEGASWNLLFEAASFAGRAPYDVLHAHFGPNGTTGARLRALGAARGKLVTTFYGYDLSRHVKTHGAGCYTELSRTGDLFLAISDTMRGELIELGFPAAKVRVHRLGVDVAALRATPRPPRAAPGAPRLVSVARLVEKKGIAHALRAVAALVRDGHEVRYSVVGDGPDRRRLEALTRELALEGRVTFLGARTRPDVIDTLSGSDVLVVPSVTASDGDREGTPVVILEAQALSIPVVASRHSAIPELVEDGVSGLLAAERDESALASAIARLVTQPELAERLARAAGSAVTERHDIHRLNDTLVELYRGLS